MVLVVFWMLFETILFPKTRLGESKSLVIPNVCCIHTNEWNTLSEAFSKDLLHCLKQQGIHVWFYVAHWRLVFVISWTQCNLLVTKITKMHSLNQGLPCPDHVYRAINMNFARISNCLIEMKKILVVQNYNVSFRIFLKTLNQKKKKTNCCIYKIQIFFKNIFLLIYR